MILAKYGGLDELVEVCQADLSKEKLQEWKQMFRMLELFGAVMSSGEFYLKHDRFIFKIFYNIYFYLVLILTTLLNSLKYIIFSSKV